MKGHEETKVRGADTVQNRKRLREWRKEIGDEKQIKRKNRER